MKLIDFLSEAWWRNPIGQSRDRAEGGRHARMAYFAGEDARYPKQSERGVEAVGDFQSVSFPEKAKLEKIWTTCDTACRDKR